MQNSFYMVSESVELGVVIKIPPTSRPPLRNRSYGGEGNNSKYTNTNLKYETLYLICIKLFKENFSN